jgi:hypothetical protein
MTTIFKIFLKMLSFLLFYATLPYIRHFIFAGCYDNDPWYLVTNLAGHLDIAGFYFSKCPANSKPHFHLMKPKFKYNDFA